MKNVFVPLDVEGQAVLEQGQKLPAGVERRRYARHRYAESIQIRVEDPRGPFDILDATTFEVSEGGCSAATPHILLVGERVEVWPIMGMKLKTIVRRKNGAMYGFEFLGLSHEQQETIRKRCKDLPLFSSLLVDV